MPKSLCPWANLWKKYVIGLFNGPQMTHFHGLFSEGSCPWINIQGVDIRGLKSVGKSDIQAPEAYVWGLKSYKQSSGRLKFWGLNFINCKKAGEAKEIKLIGVYPPIEKMDGPFHLLINCEKLSLSTNYISSISNLQAFKNLKTLSLGRNIIKSLQVSL